VKINDSIVHNNHEDERLNNMKEEQEPLQDNDPLPGSYTRVKPLTKAEVDKKLTDKNMVLEFLTNMCN